MILIIYLEADFGADCTNYYKTANALLYRRVLIITEITVLATWLLRVLIKANNL